MDTALETMLPFVQAASAAARGTGAGLDRRLVGSQLNQLKLN